MSGGSSSIYWGRNEANCKGIVVIFIWASIQERHLKHYLDLYTSLGWNSLVCHAGFLHAFYPERALSLAFVLLAELIEELRIRPSPVVFAPFSGGSKACMYKVFQIIDGICEGQLNLDDNQLISICLSGQIYDSSPVEFTNDLGALVALHPAFMKMPGPSKFISWVAKGVASGLDALSLTKFESQRDEYWQTLCSSVEFGTPFLILYSENDNLVPCQSICNFVQHIQELGGDVQLVKLNGSPHIGHYKYHPIQYRAAVTSLLEKACSVYKQKHKQHEGERMNSMHDEISELICDLQKAAVNSNQSLRRVAVGPSDHFFLPSSAEHQIDRESGSLQDDQKERSIYLQTPPSINAHSVLGKILFDVCVPKNVECWDVKFSGSLNGQPYASAHRNSPLSGTKFIRRSRL